MACFETTNGYIAQLIFRIIQFVMGIAVLGLYIQELPKTSKEHNDNGGWKSLSALLGAKAASTYPTNPLLTPLQSHAIVISSMSMTTAALCQLKLYRIPLMWAWDAILCILWFVVFGLWGKLYLNGPLTTDGSILRMKNACWVDLANALLWMLSAVGMAVYSKVHIAKSLFKISLGKN